MNQELLSNETKILIEEVLKKLKFTDFTMTIEPGSKTGDNYMGVIAKIQIKCKNSNKSLINFITKSAPKNKAIRAFIPLREAYLREIYIYTTVIPEFLRLQDEKHITNKFRSFAKCYTSSVEEYNETLVLQNMCEFGYEMRSRHQPLDYNHALLVMKEYGKLHALSFALRELKPEVFEKLAGNMEDDFFNTVEMTDQRRKGILERSERVLNALDPIRDKEAFEKFNIYRKKMFEMARDVVRSKVAGSYAVFGHGDGWINNLLFKYEDVNKTQPIEICFVDWQLSRLGSPALDLAYFLFVCTDGTLREQHYERLLKEYYASFKEFLEKFGLDGKKLFPFSMLQEHLKKFSVYALYMAILALYIILSENDEAPKAANQTETGNLMKELSLQYNLTNIETYNSRIRSVVLDFIKYEYDF